jgi:hypothetical protein
MEGILFQVLLYKLSLLLTAMIYKPSLRAIIFGAADVFVSYFPNVILKSEFCLQAVIHVGEHVKTRVHILFL